MHRYQRTKNIETEKFSFCGKVARFCVAFDLGIRLYISLNIRNSIVKLPQNEISYSLSSSKMSE